MTDTKNGQGSIIAHTPDEPEMTVKNLEIKPAERKPLKFREMFTFKVALAFIGWTAIVQVIFMLAFIYGPNYDMILIRYSLSDIQSTSWASAFIVIWGAARQEQYLYLKYGVRTGAPGVPGTDKEVSGDAMVEMQQIWAEFLCPILKEARDEWKTLSPKEQKEIIDDARAQIRKKVKEYRSNGSDIPPQPGKVRSAN
jgi:hypothetical protein